MVRRLVHHVRRRIAVKLTLTLVGFVGVTLLAAASYLDTALERVAVEALEARLSTAARLLHDEARAWLRHPDPAAIQAFVTAAAVPTGSRVTLVDAAGRVLGDSGVAPEDVARLDPHRTRPEVQAALDGNPGRDIRPSATTGATLLYVALPVRDGRVIGALRLALPIAAVTAAQSGHRRVMLVGGLVALAAALAMGVFVAGRVTRPVVRMQAIAGQMSEGNFDVRVPVRSPDEIGALARALNVMAARLRGKISDLEHEQARVGAILDGMVEGVVAVDGQDRIVLLNERARAMFGLGARRTEGRRLLEVIRDVDLHLILRAARAAGLGAVARRELGQAGGGERVVQVNAVPLRLAGDETGVVMVLHDETELRRLEQVRTEFIANLSHELRTPLTAIQGYLETLLSGALDDPVHTRRFLDIVFRHTERLGRLLEDLTDLSNIELGRVTLRREAVALGEVVDSALAIVRPKAAARSVALLAPAAARGLAVLADRDRLEQILLNLVDNAVKYTPEGGRVEVDAGAAAGGAVEVVVRDSGIGIPPTDLPRITERFYRVDKARSRELGGTGLGLAIVKHLVLAHGGELRIESQAGQGTTVRVTLPPAPGPGGVEPARDAGAASPSRPPADAPA